MWRATSKKGRHRKSHLDAAGDITGVASGECLEGLAGTCGGCLSHGLNGTKHALKMCPLEISTVMDVLNSTHLLRAMAAVAKAAGSAKSHSGQSGQGDSSKQARKRSRDGEPLGGAASSVSGRIPYSQHQPPKAGKDRGRSGAKGSAGKGRGRSKGSAKARTTSTTPSGI